MVLMGYHVFVSAQSNNGVNAVFQKVVKWARKNGPQRIEDGIRLRVRTSTVYDALFKELGQHWEDSNVDEEFSDGMISSISASNIPDCAAYKIAKYAGANPTENSCLTYTKYANAKAEKKRKFETGQVKVSGATVSRGSAMKACIGKPRLSATTSAASQREVVQRILGLSDVDRFYMVPFDEASQATEASLMLISNTIGSSTRIELS